MNTPAPVDYSGDAYRACMAGNADKSQQQSAAAQIALLHGEIGEARRALTAAEKRIQELEDAQKAIARLVEGGVL